MRTAQTRSCWTRRLDDLGTVVGGRSAVRRYSAWGGERLPEVTASLLMLLEVTGGLRSVRSDLARRAVSEVASHAIKAHLCH